MRYRIIGQNPGTRRKVSVLSLGAMLFGTATDEATSFAILDRYVEAAWDLRRHLEQLRVLARRHPGRRE